MTPIPSEFDLAQENRFNRYIETKGELDKKTATDIAEIRIGVNWLVGISSAIGLMILTVIGAWIKKRLEL